MIIINSLYLVAFLVLNIIVLKKRKKVDNNLLFDLLSTNILVMFKLLMFHIYKNINYTILFDFLLIFIYEIYKKDLQTIVLKDYITILEFVNLIDIIILFR